MLSRKKRFIVLPALIVVLIIGGTIGTVLAQKEATSCHRVPFVETVAGYLDDIEANDLLEAFSQARSDMQALSPEERSRDEFKAAVASYLDISTEQLQAAIDQAKEAMKEQIGTLRAEMQEKMETRRTEMQERFAEGGFGFGMPGRFGQFGPGDYATDDNTAE